MKRNMVRGKSKRQSYLNEFGVLPASQLRLDQLAEGER
jgi:hypothetical protein